MMEETDVSDADLLAAVEYLDPRMFQMYHWKIEEDYFIMMNLLDSFWFICSYE